MRNITIIWRNIDWYTMAYNDRERGKRHKECSFLRSRSSYDNLLRTKLTFECLLWEILPIYEEILTDIRWHIMTASAGSAIKNVASSVHGHHMTSSWNKTDFGMSFMRNITIIWINIDWYTMVYNDRERGKRHKECSFLRSRSSYDIFLEQNWLLSVFYEKYYHYMNKYWLIYDGI